MKDLSKITKDFEKLPYKGYVRERPKHEPTDSYFHLVRHISKCMMRADALKSHVEPVRTKMTGTQQITISPFFSFGKERIKRDPCGKTYYKSVIRTSSNQKKLLYKTFLRRKEN